MSRLDKLFRSSKTRSRPARKARLGVEALETREVPATFSVTTFNDLVNPSMASSPSAKQLPRPTPIRGRTRSSYRPARST